MNKRIALLLALIISFVCTNKVKALHYTASGTTFTGLSNNCTSKNCAYDSTNRMIVQVRLYYVDQGSFAQIGHTVYYADTSSYNLLKNTDLKVIGLSSLNNLSGLDKYEKAKTAIINETLTNNGTKINENGKKLFKMLTGVENYDDILRKDTAPWSGDGTPRGYRLVVEPAFIIVNPTFGTEKYGMITSRGKMIEYLRGKTSLPTLSSEERYIRNQTKDVGIPARDVNQCNTAVPIQYVDMQYGCGYRMIGDRYTNRTCYDMVMSDSGNKTCKNTGENNVTKYSESYAKATTCTTTNKTNTQYGSYKTNNGTCKLYCKEEALVSLPGKLSTTPLRGSYFAWPSIEENSSYKMLIKSYLKCTIIDEGGDSNKIASNVTTKCPEDPKKPGDYVPYDATTCRSKTDIGEQKCPDGYPLEYKGKCYAAKDLCPTVNGIKYKYIDGYCFRYQAATKTDKYVPFSCDSSKNELFIDSACYPVSNPKTTILVEPKDKVCPTINGKKTYLVNGKCYKTQNNATYNAGGYERDYQYNSCTFHFFGDEPYCSYSPDYIGTCVDCKAKCGSCNKCEYNCSGLQSNAKTECEKKYKSCQDKYRTCTSNRSKCRAACVSPKCTTTGYEACKSGYHLDTDNVGTNTSCKGNEVIKCKGNDILRKDGWCYKKVDPYYTCSSGVKSGSYCYTNEVSKVCPDEDHKIEKNGQCYKEKTVAPYCDPASAYPYSHINDTSVHYDAEGNNILSQVRGKCRGNGRNPCTTGELAYIPGTRKRRCKLTCASGKSDTFNGVEKCVQCPNTPATYHSTTSTDPHEDEFGKKIKLGGYCTDDQRKPNCSGAEMVNGKCITGTGQDKLCKDPNYVKVGDICYRRKSKELEYSCPTGYTISSDKMYCTKTCNKTTLSTGLESTIKNNKIQAKLTAGDNNKIDENLVIYSDTVEKVDSTNYVRTAKFKISENKNRYYNKVTGAVTNSGPASSTIFDRGQGVVSLSRNNEILEGKSTKEYKLTISNIKVGTENKFDISDYTCKFTITENNPPCICPTGTLNEGKKVSEIESSLGVVLEKDLKCAGLIEKYCDYKAPSYTCKNTSTGADVNITTCVENEMKNNVSQIDAENSCTLKESKCTNNTCINVNTGEKVDIKQCLDDGNSRKVCEDKNGCTKNKSCIGNCTSSTKELSGTIYKTTKCNGEYCRFETYCLNTTNTSQGAMTCISTKLGTSDIVQSLNKNEISINLLESAIKSCKPTICEKGPLALFRIIDLSHPFPGTSGKDRTPGFNWDDEDLIKSKITNARNTEGNKLYQKEPLMTITLTPNDVKAIREYNKEKDYSNFNLKCVYNNTSSCISRFIHEKSTFNLNVKFKNSCNLNLSSKKTQFDNCYNSDN